MRDVTFSFFYFFPFVLVASGALAACSLPEGGSHARCSAKAVCAQGLVCYRTFCVEPSQASDGSIVGGDDVQALPEDLDAQVFDAAALPPSTPIDAGEDTDALAPSNDAAAPSDAGSMAGQPDARVSERDAQVAQPDAQVAQPDAQVAQPDAQVAQPDASLPADAGQPQDAGPTPPPCKGKKCCKDGKPKPCEDD